ncbi:MAG: hypothetical protein N4A65_01505 [Cohaesibacter sp.]|jgi:hypothetical protein|nr:hypothetical protein [Cohaesibacter sp.]
MIGFAYDFPAMALGYNENPWIAPGSAVHFDFAGNQFSIGGAELEREAAWSVSRASKAWAMTKAGQPVEFAVNQPRITNKGLLVQGGSQNHLAQPVNIGAWPQVGADPHASTKTYYGRLVKGFAIDNGTIYHDINLPTACHGRVMIAANKPTSIGLRLTQETISTPENTITHAIDENWREISINSTGTTRFLLEGRAGWADAGRIIYIAWAGVSDGDVVSGAAPILMSGVVAGDAVSSDLSSLDFSQGMYGVWRGKTFDLDSSNPSHLLTIGGASPRQGLEFAGIGGNLFAQYWSGGSLEASLDLGPVPSGQTEIVFGLNGGGLEVIVDGASFSVVPSTFDAADLAKLTLGSSQSGQGHSGAYHQELTLFAGDPSGKLAGLQN